LTDVLRSFARKRRRNPERRPRRPALEALEARCVPTGGYVQTNLVSDVPGLAAHTDSQLINPWGLTASSTSPFWVSDNQVGVSTLYNGGGVKQGLVVSIPNVSAGTFMFTHATPTGTVFNTDSLDGKPFGFDVTASGTTAPSIFLFDTLDGTIDGWNGVGKNAIVAVNNSAAGAVYTGLAIDTSTKAGNTLLYAADWGLDQVEVYNADFQRVDVGAFQDKAIPKDFRPFNVQDINGHIWVTYAQFNPATGADTGTGGFVDEFSRNGVLEKHINNRSGQLNSPWGLALAPAGFGSFGGDLLVGGFGDGHINAFNPHSGHFEGTLTDPTGQPITIENLWALRFGNDGNAGRSNTLFFTAGLTDAPATIFGATDGLLGSLSPAPRTTIVPHLGQSPPQGPTFKQFSTVPANGDQNPYGVAFVPPGFPSGGKGGLHPGDILVSNFNNNQNQQGTGTTIVRISPDGQQSVFFQDSPTSTEAGLTTALGILREGFVIVGNLPTPGGTLQSPQPPGELRFLNADGKAVLTLQDPKLLDGPWDLAVNDQGDRAQVFVSNVLSGTVTRIDLEIEHGKLEVESMTQIASGYKHEPNSAALVVGPTGLAFDPKTDTLYVASTDDNAIFAIGHAAETTTDQGKGTVFFADPRFLHGPLGLVLAPNGDLIVANGDAVNTDPTHPSELVEFTPQGAFVGQFSIDSGTGASFGLAATDAGGVFRLAAVNDGSSPTDPNANTLEVWTFQATPPAGKASRLEQALERLAGELAQSSNPAVAMLGADLLQALQGGLLSGAPHAAVPAAAQPDAGVHAGFDDPRAEARLANFVRGDAVVRELARHGQGEAEQAVEGLIDVLFARGPLF
jgi:uncharacterized protein (TIGR03118 family)